MLAAAPRGTPGAPSTEEGTPPDAGATAAAGPPPVSKRGLSETLQQPQQLVARMDPARPVEAHSEAQPEPEERPEAPKSDPEPEPAFSDHGGEKQKVQPATSAATRTGDSMTARTRRSARELQPQPQPQPRAADSDAEGLLEIVDEIEVLLNICRLLDQQSLFRLAFVSPIFSRKMRWRSLEDGSWSLVDEAARRRLHMELGFGDSSSSYATPALAEARSALAHPHVADSRCADCSSSWSWLLSQICISAWLARAWREDREKLHRATGCATIAPVTDFGTDRTCCIGDSGARTLGAALQVACTPPVTEINLCSNDLSAVGLLPICVGIRRTCQQLQIFDVRGNVRLGDAGVALLAGVLPDTLVELDIYTTGCRDEGITAIASVLPFLVSLERLYCGGNSVGVLGWTALAAATPAAPALRKVDAMYSNRMGCDGAKAWASSLAHCLILEELLLEHCQIGSVGAHALAASFVERVPSQATDFATLKVQLSGNQFELADMKVLEAACAKSTVMLKL